MRVSTLPITLMDEVVVIRILDTLDKRPAQSLFINKNEFNFQRLYELSQV